MDAGSSSSSCSAARRRGSWRRAAGTSTNRAPLRDRRGPLRHRRRDRSPPGSGCRGCCSQTRRGSVFSQLAMPLSGYEAPTSAMYSVSSVVERAVSQHTALGALETSGSRRSQSTRREESRTRDSVFSRFFRFGRVSGAAARTRDARADRGSDRRRTTGLATRAARVGAMALEERSDARCENGGSRRKGSEGQIASELARAPVGRTSGTEGRGQSCGTAPRARWGATDAAEAMTAIVTCVS